MAQTQEEWYQKLRKFVPSWWFEKEGAPIPLTPALFRAIGAVFAQIQQDADDAQASCFIGNATTPVLDQIGDEANKDRLTGEIDAAYRTRIRRITSQSDKQDIIDAVNALLIISGCEILESPEDNPYASRFSFCSRDFYLSGFFYGQFFTLVVPKQVHQPYSFASRSNFCSRGSYTGTSMTTGANYDSIVAIVDAMKAFGVLYRIVESTRSVLN